jgi:release factor glutamine methyltransferase
VPADPDTLVSRLRAAGCVFAEDEARLLLSASRTPDELEAMLQRRITGDPLEYVLGWTEFAGLRIAVEPGVFVPRRRTEFLVRQAVAAGRPGAVVADLCCGSGALGAAVAAMLGRVELHAADVDPVAVDCARRNVERAGGRAHLGDLYQALPAQLRGRVDILLANAPYVPSDELVLMPAEAREHEPRVALDGGADGLDVLRRVIAEAPAWLAPGGRLLVESSQRQAPALTDAIKGAGLVPRVATSDELEATIVIARL